MNFLSILVCASIFLNSCQNDSGGKTPEPDKPGSKDVPPQGQADVAAWLSKDYYLKWHCEADRHAAREPSPHGQNRICNNDALNASKDDEIYAQDSASVKEIYGTSDSIVGYAVSLKVSAKSGSDSWYWYEIINARVAADKVGDSSCTTCHAGASKDFVFTVVE